MNNILSDIISEPVEVKNIVKPVETKNIDKQNEVKNIVKPVETEIIVESNDKQNEDKQSDDKKFDYKIVTNIYDKIVNYVSTMENSIISIAIVIILFMICLFALFLFPKPKVFFDIKVDKDDLFDQYHNEIKTEIENQNNLYIKNGLIKDEELLPVIPIYGLSYIESYKYKNIYELFRTIPYVRFAGIINLKPAFEQCPSYGYAEVANDTLRCFYAVNISSTNKSGIWIDGEKKFFVDRQWLICDISREHLLFNKDKYSYTTLLWVDIDRPDNIHKGCSINDDIEKDEILKLFKAYSSNNAIDSKSSKSTDKSTDSKNSK